MKALAEFDPFFATTIAPQLEGLETMRRAALRNTVIAACVVGVVLMGIVAVFGSSGILGVLMVGGVIGLGAVAFFAALFTKDNKAAFKEHAIRPLIRFYDEECEYFPERCIPESEFRACCLFERRPDRYSGNDFVSGTLGQTAFHFSEIHAEYKTEHRNSKGHTTTSWHTIFRGVFFVADFNKSFKGQTYVFPDTAENLLGSWLGGALQKLSGPGELVKLEDPEFEKLFAVYSGDQVEARYILSQSLMRRMVEYRTKHKREMHFAFMGSQLIAAISFNEDLFEPPIWSPVTKPELYRAFLTDLDSVLSIVEELNLNLRIWTKE